MKPILAITTGDANGIGPEVAIRSLHSPAVRANAVPLLVGPPEVFRFYHHRLKLPGQLVAVENPMSARMVWQTGKVPLLSLEGDRPYVVSPGTVSPDAGHLAAQSLFAAFSLASAGLVQGIVTAPVSKESLHRAGVDVPGQTEFLKNLSGARCVAMMLVSRSLRVGLVTIHEPIERVASLITPALVRETIDTIHDGLVQDWGIRHPRLAVLGLNPHAGENGDIGKEERRVIVPALHALRKRGILAAGPFPADAFFARYKRGSYDAVVAMYHDQGLIPLKMVAEGRGVNVTLGLPIVRTSPDHGTAFDIAGKGKADASSMVEAIVLAAAIVRNRSRFRRDTR